MDIEKLPRTPYKDVDWRNFKNTKKRSKIKSLCIEINGKNVIYSWEEIILTLNLFFFFFLGPHLWHVEVPRLGVKSELLLLVYTTATATQDLSHVCDLYHSSQQCQSLAHLSKARDRPASSWILVRFITAEPPWGFHH